MNITNFVTPIASSDWDELELGVDKGTLDGNLDFLGDLDSETDVTILISNGNDGLEAGSLSGLGLLLDRYDFHDFVGEWLTLEEFVNDLRLLDWDGVCVDFLEGTDHAVLDKSAELGLWNPLIFGGTTAGTAVTTTATATATTTASSETTIATTSVTASRGFTTFWSWVSYCCICFNHRKT